MSQELNSQGHPTPVPQDPVQSKLPAGTIRRIVARLPPEARERMGKLVEIVPAPRAVCPWDSWKPDRTVV